MSNDTDMGLAKHGFSTDHVVPPPPDHHGFSTEAEGACPWCSIGSHDGCWGDCTCRITADAVP